MDTVAAGEGAGEGVEGTGIAAVRGGAEEEGVRGDRAPTWTRTEVDGILHIWRAERLDCGTQDTAPRGRNKLTGDR